MEFDKRESRKRDPRRVSDAETSRLVTATAGDHALVYALLRAANQAPPYETFLSALDEPSYEPVNRLLVKRGSQLLAHVHLLDRVAWFHGARIPIGCVESLATLPEHRDDAYARLLLSTAEQQLRNRRAVVAFAHTHRPELFRAALWSDAAGQKVSTANVNDILSRLAPWSSPTVGRHLRPLRIRQWRQVELDALRLVYHRAAATTWGAIDRSEPYWRWFVGRRMYDELIVAIQGQDNWDNLDVPSRIVGYALMRGSQVIELATLPTFRRAAMPLVTRACQDAIERNCSTLSLSIPTDDPLHKILLAAGGSWSERGRCGGTLMMKLLDYTGWIDGLQSVLVTRATAGNLALPLAISFDTGQRKYRLELHPHGGRLVRQKTTSADVCCPPDALGALFLGNVDLDAARQAGDIVVATDDAAAQLAALFPYVPVWQSRFDMT